MVQTGFELGSPFETTDTTDGTGTDDGDTIDDTEVVVGVNYERLEDAVGIETPLFIEDGTDFQSVFKAIGREYDRLDTDHVTVADETHVDTATGAELERLGALVNAVRKTNETDAQLRQRIKVRGRATVTSGTTDEMMELSALALETTVDELTFPIDLATDPATFKVEIPQAIIDDAVLSQTTVEQELERGLPVGHRVDTTVV